MVPSSSVVLAEGLNGTVVLASTAPCQKPEFGGFAPLGTLLQRAALFIRYEIAGKLVLHANRMYRKSASTIELFENIGTRCSRFANEGEIQHNPDTQLKMVSGAVYPIGRGTLDIPVTGVVIRKNNGLTPSISATDADAKNTGNWQRITLPKISEGFHDE